MVVTFYASPAKPTKAYSAEHVVLLDTVAGGEEGGRASSSNVTAAAIFLEAGEVPKRAAAIVGFEGDPNVLAQSKISKVVEPESGLITITATAGKPDEAIALANAFGSEFIKYVAEREGQRIEAESAQAQIEVDRLEQQLTELQNKQAGGDNSAGTQGQIEATTDDLGTAIRTAATARDTTSYVTLREAVSASQDAGFVSGFGRIPRALFMGVVGALAGFGVAVMLDRSDSRLRTKDQVERRFGLPVLAEVPLLALRDRSRAAVVAFEREPRVAEAYRGLRTALLLFRSRTEQHALATNGNGHSNGHSAQAANSVRQLVVVTSPEAGDGKSTTTANLAMAYAESGQSVLLVSWDLWRPLSPGVFDAQEGPGVADYLDGSASSLVRYVQDTSIPGVRIVTAGLGGHHPYTQIENARRLLEEARSLANIVIVDTAPILSASVTRELVTLADAVVVVCRSGRTTGPAADRCAELLERLGAPALGVVLVGVPTGPFADYYGAPPKGSRGLERAGFRRRQTEEAGARHKAISGAAPARPTSAGYRAGMRGPEGREPS
jgi:capsular exopolysaccharide synthesis family protein